MTAGARQAAPDASAPVFDEAWLEQIEAILLDRDGDIAHYRLLEPHTGLSWRSAVSRWAATDASIALETEHQIASRLDAAWAKTPVALIRTQDGPMVIYEDLGAQSLGQGLDLSLPLTDFLQTAVGAAAALAHAHSRHILHRDIRPAHFERLPDGVVRLASFGNGQDLDRQGSGEAERPVPDDALAYAAPEFARRTKPYADQRSDLYALGVTLYQWLTGQTPFTGQTPAEWLHAHIAISPAAPSTLRPDAPSPLDQIILKLIAKEPSGRYQSAAALHADLVRCQSEWLERGLISAFELDQDAVPALVLSKRVFGRDAEMRVLSSAFARVSQTECSELVLISGPPGCGKSALVEALRTTLKTAPVITVSGKCDQHQRDIPYGPVAQALRSLIERLLSQSRPELDTRRDRLLSNLNGHGRLVADLAPDLELVIGRAAAIVDLPAELAQARVNAAILQTFLAFTARGAPLVLFLDDLQWADESTWTLVRTFAARAGKNVLLVGAYRDTETGHAEHLDAVLATARQSGIGISQIALGPLSIAAVTGLITAATSGDEALVDPLARVVLEKTQGNPFFVGQLLRSLADEGLLRYSARLRAWTWNLDQVSRHRHADNVVDLMVRRLDLLTPNSRQVLRALACIGPRCDEGLLARALGADVQAIRRQVQPAIEAGLLFRDGAAFAFSHDRVLEAAYGLTTPNERGAAHARIASLMIETAHGGLQDSAFEIASQVERAAPDRLSNDERIAFTSVLIVAARRARSAAAVDQAADYLATAATLLGSEAWRDFYELAYESSFLRCEILVLQGELEQAGQKIETLLGQARSKLDQAAGYRLKAVLRTLNSDYEGTIVAALAGLSLLGIALQRSPSTQQMREAYDAVNAALGGRTIADLVDLPLSGDPEVEAAMALLSTLLASVFLDDGISFLHLAKMVELTLLHGPTPASPHGFGWFGVFSADRYGAYEDGFSYGQLALALIERHGWDGARAGALVAADQISAWTQPLAYALDLARDGASAAFAGGDLVMACYGANHVVSDLLVMGHALGSVVKEADKGLDLARKIQFADIARLIAAQRSFANDLHSAGYTAAGRDDRDAFKELGSASVSQSTLFWEWLYEAMSAFLYRDMARARRFLAAAGEVAWAVPAHINLSDYHLFSALALTAQEASASEPDEPLAKHRQQMARWATLNPLTFSNKLMLIDAEIARRAGDGLEALRLYEASAAAAGAAGFLHEQALAHELSGLHHLAQGLPSGARHHLRAARDGYRRWQAGAKVAQMEAEHAFLATDPLDATAIAISGQTALDMAAAMEAARALSEEIVLDRLIQTLMTSMLVHAGADYGVLLLIREEKALVEAVGRIHLGNIVVETATTALVADLAPLSILNTVMRTRKAIVFDDAAAEAAGGHAAELAARSARSVMCLPLVKQGGLVGLLYLENKLAAGVFTPSRTAMLELLAPQAAISLETARLYAELIAENARRRQSEAALQGARAELARTSHLTAMGGLAASIGHEINQPLASIIANTGASLKWLTRDEPDIAEALLTLENIQRSSLRAADIVRALRSLAKEAPATLLPVRIDDVIGEVLTLTTAEIEAEDVTVVLDLGVGAALSLADPVQLQQVVLNLVTNAVEAMADNGDKPRELAVRSTVHDGQIVVGVHDTGQGVGSEELEHIFDPFFTTKATGMGMGLAICRSIMEAHGGSLDARSSSALGSTFTFRLPLAPADAV